MRLLKIAACAALLAACGKTPEGTFVQEGASVVVTPASGKRVRLEVRTDQLVRVTSVADGNPEAPQSLMVVDSKAEPPKFEAKKRMERFRSTPEKSSHAFLSPTAR